MPKINSLITNKINKITPFSQVIVFPESRQWGSLSVEDYQDFFTALSKRLTELKKCLGEVSLSYATSNALDGFAVFLDTTSTIPFETLSMDLNIESDQEDEYLAKLEKLFIQASEKKLMTLKLNIQDHRLNEEFFRSTIAFVQYNPAITINIELPQFYREQLLQLELDRAISNNQYQRVLLDSQVASNDQAKMVQASATQDNQQFKLKRARRRQAKKNVKLAVELQAEQQQEQQIQIQTSLVQEDHDAVLQDDSKTVIRYDDFEQFYGYIDRNEFDLCKKYFIDHDRAHLLWNNFFGHMQDKKHPCRLNNFLFGITTQAAEQCLKYPEAFAFGFDLNYLPAGFRVIEYPAGSGQKILDYDYQHAILFPQSHPLAIDLTEQPALQPLPFSMIDQVIELLRKNNNSCDRLLVQYWEELSQVNQKNGVYQRNLILAFRTYFLQLLHLNEKQLKTLWQLSFDGNQFNPERFELILTEVEQIKLLQYQSCSKLKQIFDFNEDLYEQFTTIDWSTNDSIRQDCNHVLWTFLKNNDLKAQAQHWIKVLNLNNQHCDTLLRFLIEYGEQGLFRLFQTWEKINQDDPNLLKHLIDRNQVSYQDFLDQKFLNALTIIASYTDAKKQWWQALLACHTLHVSYTSLPALVNAFDAFAQKINDKNLVFYSLPEDCFQDVSNMFTALGRMLTILDYCRADDLEIQWQALSELSLKSSGAIRAFTDHIGTDLACTFVSKEMLVDEEHYYEEFQYKSDPYWSGRGYSCYKLSEDTPDIDTPEGPYLDCKMLPGLYYYRRKKKGGNDFSWHVKILYQNRATEVLNLSEIEHKKDDYWKQCLIKCAEAGQDKDMFTLFKFMGIKSQYGIGNHFIDNMDEKNFLLYYDRHLAHEKYRLSASFYFKAWNQIKVQGYSKKASYQLASILLKITTGHKNIMALNNEENSLKEWKRILKKINNFSVLGVINTNHLNIYRCYLIEDLFYSHHLKPPLPIFEKLFSLMAYAWRGANFTNLFRDLRNLIDFYDKIYDLISVYGQAIYAGMRFYTEDNYKVKNGDSIFYQHLNVLDYNSVKKFNKNYDLTLRLISTFNMRTKESFSKCFEKLKELKSFQSEKLSSKDRKKVNYVLDLLLHLDKNFHKERGRLNPQKLTDFIDDLMNPPQRFKKPNSDVFSSQENFDYIAIFRKHFEAYCAPGFFEQLKAKYISKEVIDLIEKNCLKEEFELIQSILVRFDQEGDSLDYKNIAKHIIFLVRNIEASDRLTFLHALNRDDFYPSKDSSILTIEPKDFIIFLNLLIEKKSAGDFIYFMQQKSFKSENKEEKRNDALMLKAQVYINDILPVIPKDMAFELRTLIAKLLLNLPAEDMILNDCSNKDFLQKFHEVFRLMYEMNTVFPKAKKFINKLLKQTLESSCSDPNNRKNSLHQVLGFVTFLDELLALFLNPKQEEMVEAICYHVFNTSSGFNTIELLALLNNDCFKSLTQEAKKQFFEILISLFNNEQAIDLNPDHHQLNRLLQLFSFSMRNSRMITHCYQQAPFPSLTTLFGWYDQFERDHDFNIQQQYTEFSKKPCDRDPKNEFDLNHAKNQAKLLQGVSISDDELKRLEEQIKAVQDKDVSELKKIYNSFNRKLKKPNDNLALLIAVAAELLYLSNSQEGKAFELNTTQYLALYAMFKCGRNVTEQIGTSEGKTRIMAVERACQLALGYTVDAMTVDVRLNRRDYLYFQAYFKCLGKETRLIHANSSAEDYCIGGLNYFDFNSVRLFRNKARSEGKGKQVIDPDPSKQAASIDEGDQLYFDLFENAYNYSSSANRLLQNMEWIYPLLLDFFEEEDHFKLYKEQEDLDAVDMQFMAYVRSCYPNQEDQDKIVRLEAISKQQWEDWYEAAIAARDLELDKDFTIKSNKIQIAGVPKTISEARLIANHRISKFSKYSFGVHQCLHARLNRLAKKIQQNQLAVSDPLTKVLQQTGDTFHVESEKQIIYSSGANSGLLKDYAAGSIKVATGTYGSDIERQEASIFHDLQDLGNHKQQMHFTTIPRHAGLHRKDLPIRLTSNEKTKIDALVDYIQEARAKDRPILLFCKSDQESKAMYEILSKRLGDDHIQCIHNQLKRKEEEQAIDRAGQSKMLTISTKMVGRGVHIKLKELAEKKGLQVLIDFLPSTRDLEQMISRSARYGQKGDSRIVVDKETLKKDFGRETLNDGFYTATETYLNRLQTQLDRKQQCQRLIHILRDQFHQKLCDNFYEDILEKTNGDQHEFLRLHWMTFQREADRQWADVWPSLFDCVTNTDIDQAEINELLKQYHDEIGTLWDTLRNNVLEEPGLSKPTKDLIKEQLKTQQNMPVLVLPNEMKPLLEEFKLEERVPHQVQVFKKYDPSHDGRAVVYSDYFVEWRATLAGKRKLFADFRAWYNGTGILFPNIRAWWRGELPSLKEALFAKSSLPVEQAQHESEANDELAIDHFELEQQQHQKFQQSKPLQNLKASGMNRLSFLGVQRKPIKSQSKDNLQDQLPVNVDLDEAEKKLRK